jgi:hypothetical protein
MQKILAHRIKAVGHEGGQSKARHGSRGFQVRMPNILHFASSIKIFWIRQFHWPRFMHDPSLDRRSLPSRLALTNSFGCFVLLDAGPYRLEGGGETSGFIAAGVDGQRWMDGVMGHECARGLG